MCRAGLPAAPPKGTGRYIIARIGGGRLILESSLVTPSPSGVPSTRDD